MLTVNTFFRLIILAKRQGKGKLGNGALLAALIGTLCDFGEDTTEIQRRLVITPDHVTVNRYADKLMQNRARFPHPDDPYGLPMTGFRALTDAPNPDEKTYLRYLERMYKLCSQALDPALFDALVQALLEQLRMDDSVHTLFYNCRFIEKNELFGTTAHPKKLCLEAFVTALWFHAQMVTSTENAGALALPERQPNDTFRVFLLGDVNSYIFTRTYAEIRPLLDLEQPVSLSERIGKVCPELAISQELYPLEISYLGENHLAPKLLHLSRVHLFLQADGAMGKTTLLRSQPALYLPLASYQKQIREHLLPDVSWYFLTQILLKYHYGNAYPTWETCSACEEDADRLFAELCGIFRHSTPRYTLMLDGTNEIASEQLDAFVEEIAWLLQNCKGLRLIISGRAVPNYPVFSAFESVRILGIPASERDAALSVLPQIPTDMKLLELLRSPMFLRFYLDGSAEESCSRGKILDSYFVNWKSPLRDDGKFLAFAVRFVLPFAAYHDTQFRALTRADLTDAMQSAKSLYLENERVYQNCIAPLHFHRNELLQAIKNADIVSLFIDHTGLLECDATGTIRFAHQYYRDYFAAKYILNTAEALIRSYRDREPEEISRVFRDFGLGEVWFYRDDSDEIYRLIGEICGDDKNIPDESGMFYQETALDDLLDIAREIPHFRMTENVIKVMHLVRNGLVCGVDFSGLTLPHTMPEGTYFSQNGLYPCDFRNTKVFGVFASSIPEDGNVEITLYPPENCEQYYLNCDFTGAVYFPIEENREILRRYGACVDNS